MQYHGDIRFCRKKQEGDSKIPITFREVSKNHFSVVLNGQLKSSLAIRWFGPKFSPKDVPRFYDVASITEVIDTRETISTVFFHSKLAVYVLRLESVPSTASAVVHIRR